MDVNKRNRGIARVQQHLLAQRDEMLAKAHMTGDTDDLLKAQFLNEKSAAFSQVSKRQLGNIIAKPEEDRKTYETDPWSFQASFGYKEKPVSLSYQLLRAMAKTPVINAIIRTRINQIVSFSEPQRDKYSYGYVIQKKHRFGEEQTEKLTATEEKEIAMLYDFIENCGVNQNWGGDDFDGFLKKIVRDSLTLDQMTFEIVRDKSGRPMSFYAADAGIMRIANSIDPERYQNDLAMYGGESYPELMGYLPTHVQIYQNQVTQEFYPWELCFGVRNPSTDIRMHGYGVSELEEMVATVTSMLWGEEYNRRFFKQGSAPKGLLKVKAGLGEHRMTEFRQEWNATMKGVWNSWKTPILNADEAEWIDLHKSNRDMEYSAWLEYLIKVACAIYSIDPAEVNFPLSGSSQSSALFEGSNEARIKHSKDKGLYPILKFVQKKLNRFIMHPLTEGKYEFLFVGLDAMSPQEEQEMDIKAVNNYMTVNEVRQKKGLDPIEGGDRILSPTWAQFEGNDQQAEMFGGNIAPEDVVGGYDEEDENEAEKAINPFEGALESAIQKLNQQQ